MPYDSNKNLPSHVKKLSGKKQRQWRHVWNSSYSKHHDEGKAFAMANAAVKAGEKGYIASIIDVDRKQVSKTAADYDAYGAKNGKGCASCHWYIPKDDACVLVAGDISPTGMSKFYTAPVEEPMTPLLVKLVDSESLTMINDEKEDGESETEDDNKLGLVGKLFSKAVSWFGEGESELDSASAPTPPKAFSLFRVKEGPNEGQLRFLVIFSNNFQDGHKEIFSEKAHKEYDAWVSQTGLYPELWLWHGGPGTAIGKGDIVAECDGFIIGGGYIYAGKEAIAEKAAELDTGVSHGFLGVKGVEGPDIYSLYRCYEWSLLPSDKAANSWTDYSLGVKEANLPLPQHKIDYFKNLGYTDAHIQGIEKALGDFSATLKSVGVAHKDLASGLKDDETSKPAPKPDVNTSAGSSATDSPQDKPAADQQNQPGNAGGANAPKPDAGAAAAAGEKSNSNDVNSVLASLAQSVQALAGQVAEVAAQVKELKKSDDDKIADVMTAAIQKPGSGFIASAAKENVEGNIQEQSNPDYKWFFENALGNIPGLAPVDQVTIPVVK